MSQINVTTYRVNNQTAFTHKQIWSVKEPSIEFDSKKHGDLAITFRDDGTIDIMYWSPRIPITAEGVRPAHFTLYP